jgi:tetratricopeptide (TPR) repeat protein
MIKTVAVVFSIVFSGAAFAGEDTVPSSRLSPSQMRNDELDRLFGSLQANTGLRDPAKTEAAIWRLWSQSDSKTYDVILGQGVRAMDSLEFNIAEAFFSEVIAAKPDYAEAFNKRATLFYIMRRFDESLADIEKVLDLEPRHFGALAGRGMIYQQQNKIQLAIGAYRDALQINPSMANVQHALEALEKQTPGI